MNIKNHEKEPTVQVPIRFVNSLHKRVTRIHDMSLVPKSELYRKGMSLFCNEVEKRGLSSVLKELEEV